MASLATENAEFCFNLFRELDSNHTDGNIFFSSLSIFTALAIIRLGARDNAASQMDKVSSGYGFCNESSGQIFVPERIFYCNSHM